MDDTYNSDALNMGGLNKPVNGREKIVGHTITVKQGNVGNSNNVQFEAAMQVIRKEQERLKSVADSWKAKYDSAKKENEKLVNSLKYGFTLYEDEYKASERWIGEHKKRCTGVCSYMFTPIMFKVKVKVVCSCGCEYTLRE